MNKLYGHYITWKNVGRMNQNKQIVQSYTTTPLTNHRFIELQEQLFHGRIFNNIKPKVIIA